jgi:hypothetical protein
MATKKKLRQYVIVNGNGEDAYKKDGKVVVILASSKDAAASLANRQHGFGGGNWDIRLAGDEPRIEAIDQYADISFRIGVIARRIGELSEQRDELEKEAESYKAIAYQLPENENAGF